MRNYETKRFFSLAKQLETLNFVFRETIETRRNSDLFRTVMNFAKKEKKYTKLSTLIQTTPNHHPPKTNSLPKIFFKSFLLLNWLVLHSSTSPSQQRRPLPSLLYVSFLYGCLLQLHQQEKDFLQQPNINSCRPAWQVRVTVEPTVNTSLQDQINPTAHSTVKNIDNNKIKIKMSKCRDKKTQDKKWDSFQ